MTQKKNKKQTTQSVRTTILTVDWQHIDWGTVQNNCCIVRYELPHYAMRELGSFGKLHNWYKNLSNRPCYLHTYGPHLYVKYENPVDIRDLHYSQQKLPYTIVDIKNEKDLFHAVFKTLVSDYFQAHEKFVSNANFFLRVPSTDGNFVVVLKVQFKQDWQNGNLNDFIVTSEATRLRKLTPSEVNEIQEHSKNVYYGRLYRDAVAYFKQLKTISIDDAQKKEGIFIEYHNPQNRANIPFHSVKSAKELERTRSFLLNQLIADLAIHLNHLGFPCQQKYLEMEQVDTISGNQMKQRQIPVLDRTIYVLDGRVRPTIMEDGFVEQFCNFASELFDKELVTFKSTNVEALKTGDWVLRIQDFDVDDLAPGGILDNHPDKKKEFYSSYPDLVKQTLNINPISNDYRDDMKKPEKDRKAWSVDDYLNYSIDQLKENQDEIFQSLTVCHNQLFLKDIIQFSDDLINRFPMIERLQGKVFMAYGAFVYFDGQALQFVRIDNNDIDRGAKIIQELTGKNLFEDILDLSRKRNYALPDEPKRSEDVKKRKFIVAKDYVLEIVDSDVRMLYEDREIRERLLKQEKPLPKENFYPNLESKEPPIFTARQLKEFSDFLDNQVEESYISYKDLKARYGKEIRNRADKSLTHPGFYEILGITNDTKLKKYYKQHLGLVFESARDKSVIPVYQGIWYEPTSQYYLVGSKDSMNGMKSNQERGFVYREIQCHNWQSGPSELKQFLSEEFFPLLEVNFIRHNNYTVYPFPFNLIQIWFDLEKWKTQI
jgi:hypothetical protein